MKLVIKGTDEELIVGNTYKTFRGEDVVLHSTEKTPLNPQALVAYTPAPEVSFPR